MVLNANREKENEVEDQFNKNNNFQRLNKTLMSKWKSCKEGTAANQRRSGSEGHRHETRCQQGLFAVESPLKCTLPSCDLYAQYQFMCGRYCLAGCTFALHVRGVT